MTSEAKQSGKKINRYTVMRLLDKADRALRSGAEIFETLSNVGKEPSISAVTHATMKLTRQALGTGILDRFRINRWNTYNPGNAHTECLLSLLDRCFPRQVFGDNPHETITFYDFYGHTVAWEKGAKFIRYIGETTTPSQLTFCFARAVWEHIGSPCILQACTNPGQNDVYFEYLPSGEVPTYDSKLASQMVKRLGIFLDKGVGRSLMLEGPPGTGKTCIINKVANTFGKRVLSVDISNLSQCNSSVLVNYIIRLDPDVLVINDLDRFSRSGQMLTSLEKLNQLKLLLVSVNNIKRLPRAVIRPGRFDEIFQIPHLDEGVALSIMNLDRKQIPDKMWKEIIVWPAAFIAELGKRVENLGLDCLQEEYESLKERVKGNEDENKS